MRRVFACVRSVSAVVVSGVLACTAVALPGAPVRAAEIYTQETLDRYFRLEWSKSGRNVNGYVYNTSNRRAAHMQLLVEGLDASGTVVTKTTTWVRDVPPNNRAFFDVAVPSAPSYRVSVLSFDWVEDRLDRRKAW
jgi:hypothetical protein